MTDTSLEAIRNLLAECSAEEKEALFRELRQLHTIHEFERVIGAPAEMILDAVHRAPELTRRMLRGVIADAAFRTYAVASLIQQGWRDVTPPGNFAFDYRLEDTEGPVSIQVKLQRSERGAPVLRAGAKYNDFGPEIFITETQKTRSGTDGDDNKTRPYRFGEFDVLAVSMQPSTGKWDQYTYTLGRWLLVGKNPDEMATIQPVSKEPNEFWTDDFATAALWFRAEDHGKRMTLSEIAKPNRALSKAKKKKGAKKAPKKVMRKSKNRA